MIAPGGVEGEIPGLLQGPGISVDVLFRHQGAGVTWDGDCSHVVDQTGGGLGFGRATDPLCFRAAAGKVYAKSFCVRGQYGRGTGYGYSAGFG